MEQTALEKVIEELRAQQAGFEAKLAALETTQGKSKDDIKTLADTRAELSAELANLRAEIANKEAALVASRSAKKPGVTGIEDIDAMLSEEE